MSGELPSVELGVELGACAVLRAGERHVDMAVGAAGAGAEIDVDVRVRAFGQEAQLLDARHRSDAAHVEVRAACAYREGAVLHLHVGFERCAEPRPLAAAHVDAAVADRDLGSARVDGGAVLGSIDVSRSAEDARRRGEDDARMRGRARIGERLFLLFAGRTLRGESDLLHTGGDVDEGAREGTRERRIGVHAACGRWSMRDAGAVGDHVCVDGAAREVDRARAVGSTGTRHGAARLRDRAQILRARAHVEGELLLRNS